MAKVPARQSHLRLAAHYLRRYPNTISCMGEWKRFREGVWERIEDGRVRHELLDVVRTYANGLPITNSLLNSVYNLTKAEVFRADDLLDSDADLIVFADCALQISTGKTLPLLPENYVTGKLPYNYDPKAKSDVWDSVLGRTEAEYIPFLQEFAGLCLTPSTKHEIALWCWGAPGSGKSTFIAGLEAMLGSRCCTLGLADIERSNFALAQIPGKTLAISTEQPNRFVRCAHILNALISGESMTWERKFVDPVTVRPHVKLVWAMNELPRIDSSGVGLFRRVVPVPWHKIENPDPKVKEVVETLGAAIFNWAFAGLQRLNARGHFDIPEGLLVERETYRTQNDIPKVFIMECCEAVDPLDEDGHYNKTQAGILYETYSKWCKNTGHKALSSTAFAGELERLGFDKATINGKVNYLGILLKSTDEIEVVM